jgi:formylglycine-generating enzyme required for sulfatase activity
MAWYWRKGELSLMGSASEENNERPVHSVTVKSFYLGKYEVTRKEWANGRT